MDKVDEWETLLVCYRSGQMCEADMQQRMAEDSAFKAWVLARVKEKK